MRDVGLTQRTIAERVGVTQAFVSRVIGRTATVRPSAKTEAIWREIEKALA
jgi:predicted transcriptional regulator